MRALCVSAAIVLGIVSPVARLYRRTTHGRLATIGW